MLPVGFRRYDWPYAVDQQLFADEVAIVTLVGEKQSGFADRDREKRRNGDVVGSLAACHGKTTRASLTVCAGVDFRRKTAA